MLFHEGVGGGGEVVVGAVVQLAYGERMRGKTRKRRGSEKWKQSMFEEANHGIGCRIYVCV